LHCTCGFSALYAQRPTVLNQSGPSSHSTNEEVWRDSAQTSDEQLLEQIASDDEQALAELYGRHGKSLHNYLLRLVHESGVAEDLLQEVFVAVWQGAHRFKGHAKVTTWLYRIAHNRAVSWLRRHRKETGLDELPDLAAEDDPATYTMEKWRAVQLRRALDRLSPRHRSVLELTFFLGFSYAEVAEIVGCPVGTVKSRMSHARRYLLEALASMGIEDYPE
jgi:RNA polymerase sigma-70 factor (ECF subfamily)